MTITKTALAGSLESNDCLVTLYPSEEEGLQVVVESIVYAQFGEQIESLARQTLSSLGITTCRLQIQDKGALACTLEARINAAVSRAQGGNNG